MPIKAAIEHQAVDQGRCRLSLIVRRMSGASFWAVWVTSWNPLASTWESGLRHPIMWAASSSPLTSRLPSSFPWVTGVAPHRRSG